MLSSYINCKNLECYKESIVIFFPQKNKKKKKIEKNRRVDSEIYWDDNFVVKIDLNLLNRLLDQKRPNGDAKNGRES